MPNLMYLENNKIHLNNNNNNNNNNIRKMLKKMFWYDGYEFWKIFVIADKLNIFVDNYQCIQYIR